VESKDGRFTYPPLAPELSSGWLSLLKIFGPGAIIASVTVGTGETIFAPRVGAIFGYTMFWIVLLAVVTKALLVYSGARHLVLTGEHPMQAWARFPGPRGWMPAFFGLIVAVAFPIWIAALADALASICIWVTGIGAGYTWARPAWGIGLIVVTMTLTIIQTYNFVERLSTAFLAVKLVLILAACIVVNPDWLAALVGMIVPRLPEFPDWVAAVDPDMKSRPPILEVAVLLGTVGGGVQDYLGYIGCVREKDWGAASRKSGGPDQMPADPAQIQLGRAWLRAPAFDVLFSFASVLVMSTAFMLLGAALLHPQHQIPNRADLYSQQSQFLGVIHPWLVNVYKAGVFFAILGALYGTFEVYARTAYEPLRALWPKRTWDYRRVRLVNSLFCGIGGLLIMTLNLGTVTLASIVSPFSGVLGCGLWCLAMVAVDRTQLPAPYRMGAGLRVATLAAGIVMAVAGAYTTVMSWR
jgi:Mn2+/Fe2+ NRAMP family transporter